MLDRFMHKPMPVNGVLGYGPLWNLRPDFAPTTVTFDFMHALAGCFSNLLRFLGGSTTVQKLQKVLEYERVVNKRYLRLSTDNFPAVLNPAQLQICIDRLERLAKGAPTSWKGQKWQFALYKKESQKPKPNTHDIHLFVGCVGAFALHGMLHEPYMSTVIGLLKAFSLAKVKTIARDSMQSSLLPSTQAIKATIMHAICGLV